MQMRRQRDKNLMVTMAAYLHDMWIKAFLLAYLQVFEPHNQPITIKYHKRTCVSPRRYTTKLEAKPTKDLRVTSLHTI